MMSTSSAPRPEPRNWFYFLLNLAGVLFVVTALAYAVVPVLEEKAAEAGQPATPSAVRDALRRDGWWWLLAEAGLVAVLALASMGLDRWRQWHKDRKGEAPAEPGSGLGGTP